MKAIDNFYFDKEEPIKNCLLALKSIILDYNKNISSRWYYSSPCFMYQNQIFCYLWVDKKTQFPYIAIGKGIQIKHPDLISGKRTFTSILTIDPNKDIPIEKIHNIFDMAMELYIENKVSRQQKKFTRICRQSYYLTPMIDSFLGYFTV